MKFRCCGNHTTRGHATECALKPTETASVNRHQGEADQHGSKIVSPEIMEGGRGDGCKFDILQFEHIGECKGTCDGEDGEETARMQDESGVIVLIQIDMSDPDAEEKLAELERRGWKRLSEEETRELLSQMMSGEVEVEVQTMTLDDLLERIRREPPPPDKDPFLTAKQCAEILGFSVSWVRKLCARGRLEGALKLDKIWAIPQSAVLVDD